MINKSLIDKLHKEGIIDKNSVLWWQLDFEGRRVYSEGEFSTNLREVRYKVLTEEAILKPKKPKNILKNPEDYRDEVLSIWVTDDVPILLREINLGELKIPVFVTVKPMSHRPSGWETLRSAIEIELPKNWWGMVYEQPHIRGVVIDLTDEFLFFYPFLMGNEHGFYKTSIFELKNSSTPIILDPVHPIKFYKKLIEKEWRGRRCQRKPTCLDLVAGGLEFVPFFEFDKNKPHVTIYPLPVFEGNLKRIVDNMIQLNPGWNQQNAEKFIRHYYPEKIKQRMDLPVILASSGSRKVDLLGAGYSYKSSVFYWPLDEIKYKTAKEGLESRLGLETRA